MPRPSIPWGRLKALYVERNLERGQGGYTLKQLARDEGHSYPVVQRRAKRDGWAVHMERACGVHERKVAEQVAEEVVVDHVRIRADLLRLHSELVPVARKMVGSYAKLFDEDGETAWKPNARDIATVVKTIRELGELGGLPPEQVTEEALPEEVRLNREQQVWLGQKAADLARWMRERRDGQSDD